MIEGTRPGSKQLAVPGLTPARTQQPGRIGMQRPDQRGVDGGILDDLASIHRDHACTGFGDDAEIMRDQHQRGFGSLAEIAQHSRIWACTVTSSAVVGCPRSTISARNQGRGIITRWRIRRTAGADIVDAALGRGDADPANISRVVPAPPLCRCRLNRSVSAIWCPTVKTGSSALIGSLKIVGDLPAAYLAYSATAARGQIDICEQDRSVETGEIVGQQAQDGKT